MWRQIAFYNTVLRKVEVNYMEFSKSQSLKGEITVPGDKSISHRAVMFGALANGKTEISNFLTGADCLSTISCFRQMGISIAENNGTIVVDGKGLHGLTKPESLLYTGNSGTTTRLLSGILCGQAFESVINGDESIQKRPMKRIIEPLTAMNASITSLSGNGCTPLQINPSSLKGIHYNSPVASAQVKSSILLAGLYADGITSVTEPYLSRNHSELMLNYFGANVTVDGTTCSITPDPVLVGQKVNVPSDISSAAFFIAAALIVPGSELLIRNVGINPTRDGILKVCQQMGGNITLLNIDDKNGEKTADILVKHSTLKGIVLEGSLIPTLIDEIPIIAVLACFAEGRTIIKDAQELKVKESNRIDVMVTNLSSMGAEIEGTDDGMIIDGGKTLHGAVIDSHLDHRIAMSFAIASLACEGSTQILGSECVDISYPTFYEDLNRLAKI